MKELIRMYYNSRNDTKNVPIQNFAETFPSKFVNSQVFAQARETAAVAAQGAKVSHIFDTASRQIQSSRVGRGSLVLRHSARKFWRHCVVSGGTKRRAFPRYQSKEMKMLNISFPRAGIEAATCLSRLH